MASSGAGTAIDPEFASLSISDAGVLIWRIESFKPVPVPKEFYGELYEGDAYLILHSIKGADGALTHNVHFWQGKDCSQDERGTVALKAVELDEALGGGPTQYRQVQGHETDEFFAAFKSLGGVTYKEGGVASGFNHVEPDVYPTVLYHVKGKRNVRTNQVAVAATSLNEGDVFILDQGLKLFLWWGKSANKQERLKGMQVMARLYNSRGARPVQVVVNDEPENAEFWAALGGSAGDVASAEAGGADDDSKALGALKLYRVSDAGGAMDIAEVPLEGGKLQRSALDTSDTFIVDGTSQVFVWTGKGATGAEKKEGMKAAKAFIEKEGRPEWTPVQRVVEGGETPVFKALFHQWDPTPSFDFTRVGWSGNVAESVTAKEIDFSAIAKANSEADNVAVDDGSGTTQVWILEGTDKNEYPADKVGEFFSGDSYLVQYTYSTGSGTAHMIYFWLGRDSEQVERGSAAMNAVDLSKSLPDPSTQVRVVQGHEPWHFARLFDGGMVVHAGGRAGQRGESEGNRLYHVRGTNAHNTKAVEVDCTAANLNSGDCFVIVTPDFTLQWNGKHASEEEKATALAAAGRLGGELYTIEEGEEDETFWEHLGGKAEYPEAVPAPGAPAPKLLHVNDHAGYVGVETIFAFSQEDLADDDVFVLDTFTQVFVWVGSSASEAEKDGAMDIAAKYIAACTDGRDADTPVVRIEAGSEPPIFTCNFQGWQTAAAGFVDPYEAKLAKLRAEREASKAAEEGEGAAAPAEAAPAPAPAPAAAAVADGTTIPYEELKAAVSGGGLELDWSAKEQYLSAEEFATVFGMDKAAFAALPGWKRKAKKKDVGLF